jgi:hypothetical protein
MNRGYAGLMERSVARPVDGFYLIRIGKNKAVFFRQKPESGKKPAAGFVMSDHSASMPATIWFHNYLLAWLFARQLSVPFIGSPAGSGGYKSLPAIRGGLHPFQLPGFYSRQLNRNHAYPAGQGRSKITNQ